MTWQAWGFLAEAIVALGLAVAFRVLFHRALDQRDDALAAWTEAQQWNRLLLKSVLRDVDPPDELTRRRRARREQEQ